MEFPDTLDVDWVTTDQVFPSPSNPRRNDDAVGHVAASLRRFGWRQPIVAKPDGEVIAGNTRLKRLLIKQREWQGERFCARARARREIAGIAVVLVRSRNKALRAEDPA